jgi:glycosyltransferase involved in cell wall biosynthesis
MVPHEMKILLINYRYFVSGGPERYMFNVQDALTAEGHEVIPFSINYPVNVASEYSRYFVPPLDESGSVYFSEHKSGLKTYLKTIERLFYSKEVERALLQLVDDVKPDLAYVLHYLRKLSPSVLVALKKRKIPIVVRLSDYQMLCPQAHCLRDNSPCEDCVGGSLLPSIRYKCVKGSAVASILNFAATKYHLARGYFDYIDRYVVTNEFAKSMMLKGGVSEDRLEVIPTFAEASRAVVVHDQRGDYITYVGRLDPTKGVDVLIRAFILMCGKGNPGELKLVVIGEGAKEYVDQLKAMVLAHGLGARVEFTGRLSKEEVDKYLRSSLLSVVPSRWYENLPNSVLESYAVGTPVLASKIGSLTEMILEGQTGGLFEAGNADDLARKLCELTQDRSRLKSMGEVCKRMIESKYSRMAHLAKLESLFKTVARQRVE